MLRSARCQQKEEEEGQQMATRENLLVSIVGFIIIIKGHIVEGIVELANL